MTEENRYIIDPESAAEMARLIVQAALITRYTGPLLPTEGKNFHQVLDLACGPGEWALSVATAYPDIQVTALDISETMLQYARALAHTQHRSNIQFLHGNILHPLPLLAESFDFIHARLLQGILQRDAWVRLPKTWMSFLRPGGTIRLTESGPMTTTSPALERLALLATRAFWRSGRSFTPIEESPGGVAMCLTQFLREAGYQSIHYRAYAIDFSMGMDAHDTTISDCLQAYRLMQPFHLKMNVATREELETLYQQATQEAEAENFCGVWYLMSATGIRP
jgi:ubiquinone/menaquinone biosynthesis C-methylase UbiE